MMYFVPDDAAAEEFQQADRRRYSLYAGAIVLETDRPMNDMETLARNTLAGINPNLSIVKFQTFDQQIADQFTASG